MGSITNRVRRLFGLGAMLLGLGYVVAFPAYWWKSQAQSIAATQSKDNLILLEQEKTGRGHEPEVFELATEATDPAERARRQARNSRYDGRGVQLLTALPPGIEPLPLIVHAPPLAPLPAAQSEAVVLGEVANAQPYLSNDQTSVYTEFSIRVEEVLKNDSQTIINPGATISAEREGGALRLPSGRVLRFGLEGYGLPHVGGRCLFFLGASDQGPVFSILKLYELSEGSVRPLDRADRLDAGGRARYSDTAEPTFLKAAREAVASPQPEAAENKTESAAAQGDCQQPPTRERKEAWEKGTTHNVYIDWRFDYLPGARGAIKNAFEGWQAANEANGSGVKFAFDSSQPATYNVIWAQNLGGPQGTTGGNHNGSNRTSAYTLIDSRVINPTAMSQLMLHEIGHTLGLDHCSNCNSVMKSPVSHYNDTSRPNSPTSCDNEAVSLLYNCDSEEEPNETPEQANPLGDSGQSSGSVAVGEAASIVVQYSNGARDWIEDLFKVTLSQSSPLDLTLIAGNPTADLDLFLLSVSGIRVTVLGVSNSSAANERFVTPSALAPGTYYIGVSAFRGSSSYTLTARVEGATSGQADISLTNVASPGSVAAGANVTYTITVTNNGPAAATSITVTDELPAGVTFASCAATSGGVCRGSGNSQTVTFGALAPGASAMATLVAAVNCSVANGAAISNTAAVSATTRDPNSGNNSASATISVSNLTSLSSTSASFPASGGMGNVDVTTSTGCPVIVTSDASWLKLVSIAINVITGQKTVKYSVEANPGASSRAGALTITGQRFVVTQAGSDAARIEIIPAAPTANDNVSVRISGEWANGCIPLNPQPSISGNQIRIVTTNCGQFCTQAFTSWSHTVFVGRLAPGNYQVIVIHNTCSSQTELGRKDFSVQAPQIPTIILQAENGSVPGLAMPRRMPRSNAWERTTVLLYAGESLKLPFQLSSNGCYELSVRYSNDNYTGPLESVVAWVDGVRLGQFTAENTRSPGLIPGSGWDVFRETSPIGTLRLQPGAHEVILVVSGGDGYGVEIDAVRLPAVSCPASGNASAVSLQRR
jgi:uncharacterized repeat protein (TIGR01451 family)